MKKLLLTLALAAGSVVFALVNPLDPNDPVNYPSKGDPAWCDTTGGLLPGGVIKKYEDIYRGDAPYNLPPTPKDPNVPSGQPAVYYSPTIDGFLEDSLWKFAETLLINTWTDDGMADACSNNPKHTGPRDLHAVWRFMYNREAVFVGVETFDDIHDVDSLKGWYNQDGIEIGMDPYDWGYYAAGYWRATGTPSNSFKRYVSNNQQLIPCGTSGATCLDESANSFFHILKRMNEEKYVTGFIHGVQLAHYGRGDEATNFRMGDNNMYGIEFAVKSQGLDPYFREVWDMEFKFPFHTELFHSLESQGYFDATGLPKSGTLLKMDFFSNDDDILGPDGANPNVTQVGRRRDVPFAQEASGHDHWSDTKYYQTFKYTSTNSPVLSPVVGVKTHGDLRIADVWVDAATEQTRYSFTQGGAINLWGTFYFYDSSSAAGGVIKGTSTVANYRLAWNGTKSFSDTLIITPTGTQAGQPTLTLVRFLALGYDQVEGRWIQSKVKQAPYRCNPDSTVYSWEPESDTALELRFVPSSKIDSNGLKLNPIYDGKQSDTVRIYRFKTQQLLKSYAYTARAAVSGRSAVWFTYDFAKLAVYENEVSFPRHLVVNWGGQQKFFASYGKFNTVTFGETGANKNYRFFFSKLTPKNNLYPFTFVMWDKYTHQVFYVPDTTLPNFKQFVVFYPDMIMGRDSTKASYWQKLYDIKYVVDTVQLVGYSPTSDATSLVHKAAGEVWGDSVWLRQEVSFVVIDSAKAVRDSFVFWDTTQTQTADEFLPNYIAKCDSFISVEDATGPVENLELGSYPNPFNPAATVLFSIPSRMSGQYYSIKIFNIRGQLVRTLMKGKVGLRGISHHRVVWAGNDNEGHPMGSGLYYYKLIVGNQVKRGTMVMVK